MSNKTLNRVESVEDLKDQLHDLRMDHAEVKRENQTLQKEVEAAEKKYWDLNKSKEGVADTARWENLLKEARTNRQTEIDDTTEKFRMTEERLKQVDAFVEKLKKEVIDAEKKRATYREKFVQALSIVNFVSNGSIEYLMTPAGKKLLEWAEEELSKEGVNIMKGTK
jgi:uncharacterized protein (DUF3084 family)